MDLSVDIVTMERFGSEQTSPVVREYTGPALGAEVSRLESAVDRWKPGTLSYQPGWLTVLRAGLRHEPYLLEAVDPATGTTRGVLALGYVASRLFGRFLVSLPYVNYGGMLTDDDSAAAALVDHAVALADRLDVRYLELRQEQAVSHPKLTTRSGEKVHMRLTLPGTADELWKKIHSKTRNQVRKGEKQGFSIHWGGIELLDDFYAVFSHNMRDLGTPVFGRRLFRAILEQFPGRAELCVVRSPEQPLATALLLHGAGTTEVPSASSLRQFNPTCVNVLMYWKLLERAVERGQDTFDFGRSSPGGPHEAFKSQWGSSPFPAEWQYYLRAGQAAEMRTHNPKYQRMIRVWQRLPVPLTRWIGPSIVRGIP